MGCGSIGKPEKWCPGGPTIGGYDAAACRRASGSRSVASAAPSAFSVPSDAVNEGTMLAGGVAAALALAGVVRRFVQGR